jgi:hypothetical protein
MSSFELHRADLTERRMSTPGIVERFNVIEDVGARRIARRVGLAIHALLLERSKETLDRRVVPAIAASTHAAGDAFGGEQALEVAQCCVPDASQRQ